MLLDRADRGLGTAPYRFLGTDARKPTGHRYSGTRIVGARVGVRVDRIRIENPLDWNYPFSQAMYDDEAVVYHGTSSTAAADIDARGLMPVARQFPLRVLQDLIAACDATDFRSWHYWTVKGLSEGTDLSRPASRHVYLSANFWYAREYATNLGGETVHNALGLTNELLALLRHRGDSTGLIQTAAGILAHLAAHTAGAIPIVYALRVEPAWLTQRGRELERTDCGGMVITEANISCDRPIPADRLLGSVEYPRGAESGYQGPQPKSWYEARRMCS
jgi:hypothetical protein